MLSVAAASVRKSLVHRAAMQTRATQRNMMNRPGGTGCVIAPEKMDDRPALNIEEPLCLVNPRIDPPTQDPVRIHGTSFDCGMDRRLMRHVRISMLSLIVCTLALKSRPVIKI
jgi:hypothetical protein